MVDTECCDERLTKAVEFVVSQCHGSAAIRMVNVCLGSVGVLSAMFLNM